jgi:hypothetical protein
LFPLEPGKGVKFNATRTVRQLGRDQPVTVQEDWRCEVAGTASVATQAGNFQTWRVDCAMRETPAVTGTGEVRRSFYYAPDIGFYVRTVERIGGGPTRETNLSSYTTSDPILSTSALRQRSIELQRALEAQPSGSQATWSDATTGAAGKVMVIDTRSSERYGWCRDFAERISWSGRSYSLHGVGSDWGGAHVRPTHPFDLPRGALRGSRFPPGAIQCRCVRLVAPHRGVAEPSPGAVGRGGPRQDPPAAHLGGAHRRGIAHRRRTDRPAGDSRRRRRAR